MVRLPLQENNRSSRLRRRALRSLMCGLLGWAVAGCGGPRETASVPTQPEKTSRDEGGPGSRIPGHASAERKSASASPNATDTVESAIEKAEQAIEQAESAGDHEAAVRQLVALSATHGSRPQWHHRLWQLLNRQGRRHEASLQAEILSANGQATLDESLSLIRRHLTYPPAEKQASAPDATIADGLAAALWHFSRRDYAAAQQALQPQAEAGFTTTAAAALYGRVLAESEQYEQIPLWLHRSGSEPRVEPNYWAALGVWLGSMQQPRAAIGATLEAVRRNPTDRVSYQRIASWFHALGNREQGEQFWHRGLLLSDAELLSDFDSPGESDTPRADQQRQLAMTLLNLGRPIESLQWTLHAIGPSDGAQRKLVLQRMAQLRARDDLAEITTEHHLIGTQPREFPFQDVVAEAMKAMPADTLSRRPGTTDRLDSASPAETSSALPRPVLDEVAERVGLDFTLMPKPPGDPSPLMMHEALGSGIAVVDYDLDGWPDLYFGQAASSPPDFQTDQSNEFFRNLGGRFQRSTADVGLVDTGYAFGIASGDINQDGFPDLFVANLGVNRLYVNNGDGTYREVTDRLGSQRGEHYERLLAKVGSHAYLDGVFTTSVAIGDVNGDQLPDLFEANYVELEDLFVPLPPDRQGRVLQKTPRGSFAEPDRCYLQQAEGTFHRERIDTSVSPPGSALGVILTNIDGQGDNEVFIGNDARPNHLLRRSGQDWSNVADLLGIANSAEGVSAACMGIATADFDANGRLDFFITNFASEPASFYLQNESGFFLDQHVRYGLDELTRPYVGFGCKAIDLDRDGESDLVVTNGHVDELRDEPYEMPPQCLMRVGDRYRLVEPEASSSDYWTGSYLGRTMVLLDYNRDSRLDVVLNHLDRPVALLENQTPATGGVLQLECVGTTSERDAVGAIVTVTSDDVKRTQWVTAGDGFMCTDEHVIEVSLGAVGHITSMDVVWPSGLHQTFSGDLSLNARYLLVEGEEPFRRE